MTPADRLVDMMSNDRDVPLAESLLLLADCRPDSSDGLERGTEALDRLASTCPGSSIGELVQHVFVDEGFAGDRLDFHDPRNSYLDEVLNRRVGMPITLSVVLVETAHRIGVELVGVGMPGHFLVRERDDLDGFIDPFQDGVRISAAACEARFRALHGPDAEFHPSFLNPVANRSIVQRVLNNLTVTFRSRAPRDLDWLLDLRLRFAADPPELRALADMCELRGRYADAADLLDRMGEFMPDGPATDRSSERATRLRARLN